MPFVILIGASGSGKTTISRAISRRFAGEVEVFHFDSIGVPSAQTMCAEHGSAGGWQRAQTLEWMAKLSPPSKSGRGILFEGQTRLSFLTEAAAAAGDPAYLPILVDCNDETRFRRLTSERHQPELATEKMMNWARCLRLEAEGCGCEILDTSTRSLEECVTHVMARMRAEHLG